MSMMTVKALLSVAQQNGFCVPAFNVHNMEYVKGVIKAAETLESPIIMMIGEPILKFAGLETLANIALHAANKYS